MKVKVLKSQRKTLSVMVDDNCNVIVKAPLHASKVQIENFIKNNKSWINNAIDKQREYNFKYNNVLTKKHCYIYGELISYFNGFKRYYENLAGEYLTHRLNYLKDKFNFEIKKITLKNLTSKFGSCNSKKEIVLNKKLVFMPKRVIDYVIMHELCHTLYLNHKSEFHKLLSSFFEDEKLIKCVLKDFSPLLKIKY